MKKGGIRMQYDLLLKGGMLIDSAHVLGMPDQIGSLKTGAVGDAVVFKMETGSFDFVDANQQIRTGSRRPVPTTVIRSGKIYP